ncbi:B2 protein-like [Durio zibethinus]|uniref:B2 protein-like n=1 Tax=Durio zibethinus TaxID=66656 RepID=A0A6P5WZX9_DURZI|nr:B2 protein-like [Durio zibethinus]
MENNQQSFWQFSDQLRVQNSNLANLSLNDSIWSNSYVSKRPDERRNFDIRVGGEVNSVNNLTSKVSDFNSFNNDGWKIGTSSNNIGFGPIGPMGSQKNDGINGGFNKGIYSKPGNNNNFNVNLKGNKNKAEDDHGIKSRKKNSNKKNNNNNTDNNNNNNGENNDGKSAVDKRFKTLPPSESLPRNETVGGYIFVCNNDTMQENLRRQLFGLPSRYRDSVRAITPGLPLFLYNYSTHQLHGIFEAASFGGTNIDPTAWEDKKCPGESRFPAQVRVITRKSCEPLEEDSFRPILHHYDGPKFRLELNVPEALSLLDIFGEQEP